jgi:acetyl/propionyl-CoA carboxylase alpha subunit
VDVRLRSATRAYDVGVAADGDALVLTVDGARHRVATLGAGPRTAAAGGATVEELALAVDGRSVRVVVARTRGRVLVAIDGRVHAFEAGDEARAGRAGGAGSGRVTAPMPGKVVAVLVAVGDAVEPGQPLVVLEAMKMESTLAAEVAGTVAALPVTAGATVGAGDLLVEIAPAA